jgi:predicted dehydrogenase
MGGKTIRIPLPCLWEGIGSRTTNESIMSKPLRVGIVGCGSVSYKYWAQLQALRVRGLAEPVAACDVSESTQELVENEWGLSRFTHDYRQITEADDIDLVLVLTSMQTHAEVSKHALQAGKHVLVEKPMATTLEDAQTLVQLVHSSGSQLLCAPHVLVSPTYQAIDARLQAGDLGRLFLARARYGHGGPGWGPWFYKKGGGALFDLGVYNFTTLTGWLGPAQRVSAMLGTAIPERVIDGETVKVEADDNAHVLLDFGQNCYAVVTTGFTMQAYKCPAIELYGEKGTLNLLGDDWAPDGYEIYTHRIGEWQRVPETDPGWHWADGLRHFVECIHSGTKPVITPEHACHVLEIMLKAQASGRDGQTKTLETRF